MCEAARGARTLVIANALDDLPTAQRLSIVSSEVAQLADLGLAARELDLREHFGDRRSLPTRIEQSDVLWVVGGNTFTLCRALVASNGIEVIRAAVHQGLVYAGYSAGSVAAGPDLAAIDLVDDANALPSGYPTTAASTFGFIGRRIVPHARPGNPGYHEMRPVIASLRHDRADHLLLGDGQALIVDDAAWRIDSVE